MSTRNPWLAVAVLAAAAPAALAQQQITKRANVAPDVTVEVSNVQGSVTITGWDRNEVELVAELESSKDELEFEAPFGIIGRIFSWLVLTGYMRRFLERRNAVLKRVAESGEWRRYLG